jgi:putative ABC transport system substrate-binding protein
VDRIFKGAKPADMPVEQPDKYDFIVDLSAARELGVKLPASLLARADRVIE